MKKLYVIDTNVIMSDPHIISKLKEDVLIPLDVLKELDSHKKDEGEVGRNVREFTRAFDVLRKSEAKSRILLGTPQEGDSNDEKIIKSAEMFMKGRKYDPVLLTNDLLMSIISESYGLKVERYMPGNVDIEEDYTGIVYEGSYDYLQEDSAGTVEAEYPNQYVVGSTGKIERLNEDGYKSLGKDKAVYGIRHKNVEQRCALDALMDDNISLVTLTGKAGSGKTLLTIAAGLEKMLKEKKYRKILISRPTISMGNEIGFLPGTEAEKLEPWMRPIMDNFEQIFEGDEQKGTNTYKELEGLGLIKVEALAYIRGRSIPGQWMIIDEAQNLSKHEVKTIISRAGMGTKIILIGDVNQIDNPRLDSTNNGLSYAIEKFKDQSIAAHVTFTKGERSALATIASEIL